HLLQKRESPAAFVDLVGGQTIAPLHNEAPPLTNVIQGNQALTLAALGCHCVARLVGQKMFERRKQVRTQSSLFFADSIQILPLQYQSEKTLSKILRLLSGSPLLPHKAVNGSPITAVNFFERLLCR